MPPGQDGSGADVSEDFSPPAECPDRSVRLTLKVLGEGDRSEVKIRRKVLLPGVAHATGINEAIAVAENLCRPTPRPDVIAAKVRLAVKN